MTLVSLVYVSYATEPMSGAELEALMAKSSANNKPLGVTGMLLYRQGFFIQVLEGEEDVVMPLYEKINEDPRHENVITVQSEEVAQRSFDRWAMGFRNLDGIDLSTHPEYADYEDFSADYFATNPSRAVAFLRSFHAGTSF